MSMNNPEGKRPSGLVCGPGRTKQADAAACDINRIVARYKKTGVVEHLASARGVFADVSQVQDLRGTLERVSAARDAFETLPVKVRQRFQNDPLLLVEFLSDAKNIDEAVSLGLAERKDSPPVVKPPDQPAA